MYRPTGQSLQVEAPFPAKNLPTGQLVQDSRVVSPMVKLYFPVGHAEHTDMPLLCPYLPLSQGRQESDPGGLYFPLSHMRHVSELIAPTASEYVPPLHFVHSGNSPRAVAMKRPGLHGVHTVAPVLFIDFPSGQARQAVLVIADDVIEYRPIPQRVQEIDPALVA